MSDITPWLAIGLTALAATGATLGAAARGIWARAAREAGDADRVHRLEVEVAAIRMSLDQASSRRDERIDRLETRIDRLAPEIDGQIKAQTREIREDLSSTRDDIRTMIAGVTATVTAIDARVRGVELTVAAARYPERIGLSRAQDMP